MHAQSTTTPSLQLVTLAALEAFNPASELALRPFFDMLRIQVSPMDRRLDHYFKRLEEMEDHGYDLSAADGSVVLEALRHFDALEEDLDVFDFQMSTMRRPFANGVRKTVADTTMRVRLRGEHKLEGGSSEKGPMDASRTAFAKAVGKAYTGFIAPDVTHYDPVTLGDVSSGAAVRVSTRFKYKANGETFEHGFQHTNVDSNEAMFWAVRDGFTLALYEQRQMGIAKPQDSL